MRSFGGEGEVIESDCIFLNHSLIEIVKLAAAQARKIWPKITIVQGRHIPRIRGK